MNGKINVGGDGKINGSSSLITARSQAGAVTIPGKMVGWKSVGSEKVGKSRREKGRNAARGSSDAERP